MKLTAILAGIAIKQTFPAPFSKKRENAAGLLIHFSRCYFHSGDSSGRN